MPKYKYGKQDQQMSFQEVQEKVKQAAARLNTEALAYFWLLYYIGSRKSEMYERIIEDAAKTTETHFILDLHKRKKGGAAVPPIKIPLWFPGMDLVMRQLEKARKHKPKRKLIEKTKKKIRTTERVRARWLFPHVHRTWADKIVKEILGVKYYPHFLRLNRITEIARDEGANMTRIKSFTGIKSTRIIESYMGVSEEEQEAAVDFMAKQIKKDQ